MMSGTLIGRTGGVMLALSMLAATPAIAGNQLIAPNMSVGVAKSGLTVTADREWNKLGARPGRNSETWTLDGDDLNGLNFYGGIESGRTLFREVNKKQTPLPHFSTTMLLTDVPDFMQSSVRIAFSTTLFEVRSAEPVKFLGQDGIHFRYTFRKRMEDVSREGDATATIIKGRLYMITYEGPGILYFDRDIGSYRKIVESARLVG